MDGVVEGSFIIDDVYMNNIVIPNQMIGVAHEVNVDFLKEV